MNAPEFEPPTFQCWQERLADASSCGGAIVPTEDAAEPDHSASWFVVK